MNDQVETCLARLRSLRWAGPDRNPRVEEFLKERVHMNGNRKKRHLAIAIALAATFAGGALAGGVGYHLVSERIVVQDGDGNHWEVEIPAGGEILEGGIYRDPDGNMYQLPANFMEEGEWVPAGSRAK